MKKILERKNRLVVGNSGREDRERARMRMRTRTGEGRSSTRKIFVGRNSSVLPV